MDFLVMPIRAALRSESFSTSDALVVLLGRVNRLDVDVQGPLSDEQLMALCTLELSASLVNQVFVGNQSNAALVLFPTNVAAQLLHVCFDHVVLERHLGAEDPVAFDAVKRRP